MEFIIVGVGLALVVTFDGYLLRQIRRTTRLNVGEHKQICDDIIKVGDKIVRLDVRVKVLEGGGK